jgi:PAS domain S-box-containing protein
LLITSISKRKTQYFIDQERRLSNYYKEFQTIFTAIGDGVITTDLIGCITKMNYVAEKLTGWKESEAFGVHIDEYSV